MNIEIDEYFDISFSLTKYTIHLCIYTNGYYLRYTDNLCFNLLYDSSITINKENQGININYINISSHEGSSFVGSKKCIKIDKYYSCICNQQLYKFKNEWLSKDKFKDNFYINKIIIYFSIINYVIKSTKNKLYYVYDIPTIKKYNRLYLYKIYNYI
jgi:hypothetical protein